MEVLKGWRPREQEPKTGIVALRLTRTLTVYLEITAL